MLKKILQVKNVISAIDLVKKSTDNNKVEIQRAKEVKQILEKNEKNDEIIIAIILDKLYSNELIIKNEIKNKFGQKIMNHLEDSKKVNYLIEKNYGKIKNEMLSSIILEITNDIDSITIRIIQRLWELQNIKLFNKNEQSKIINISKEIYYPLATKIGLKWVEREILNECFKIENPKKYKEIKEKLGKSFNERKKFVEKIKSGIKRKLNSNGLKVSVFTRPKSIYSIYKKLNEKKINFSQLTDLYGVRIVCENKEDCYTALGLIHENQKIIKQGFDDYFSKPKGDYQGIHTAIEINKFPVEFQIRTWKQHFKTEASIYWKYKKLKESKGIEKELSWNRELSEWNKSIGEKTNFIKIKTKNIFVFTPKNEIIILPKNSTVIDFAFSLHTDIGKKIKKAIVNGKSVKFEKKLKSLDKVKIIVGKKLSVKEDWLNFVVSNKAKMKIKSLLGLKKIKINKQKKELKLNSKKIRIAECCNPLPGEDVIGIKTTKRKIVIHKKNCPNIKKIPKEKKVVINYENKKGLTKISIKLLDRPGIFSEILEQIRKSGSKIISNTFSIRKSGYAEAIIKLETGNIKSFEKMVINIENITGVLEIRRF